MVHLKNSQIWNRKSLKTAFFNPVEPQDRKQRQIYLTKISPPENITCHNVTLSTEIHLVNFGFLASPILFLVALACVPTYDIHVTITYMLPCLKCFYRNSVPFSTTTILNILAVVLQNALTYIFSKISTELSVYKHATRRYRQMTLVKFFLKKA